MFLLAASREWEKTYSLLEFLRFRVQCRVPVNVGIGWRKDLVHPTAALFSLPSSLETTRKSHGVWFGILRCYGLDSFHGKSLGQG